MANEYANLTELKKALNLDSETFADADLTLALTAASRGIDAATRRRFFADADANQVRHYSPGHASILPIDDLVELTSLESDPEGDGSFAETWTVNTDFVLEPLNAPADGEPWTLVSIHPNSARTFPELPRSIRVKGKFGWAAVPPQIKEATLVIAAKLTSRVREAPFGVVSLGDVAARIATSDPDVNFLIRPFQSPALVV